jgi:hypothetical protein
LFDIEILERILESRKILIGSCTIKSIADFKASDEELSHFIKYNSTRGPIHLINIDDERPIRRFNKQVLIDFSFFSILNRRQLGVESQNKLKLIILENLLFLVWKIFKFWPKRIEIENRI